VVLDGLELFENFQIALKMLKVIRKNKFFLINKAFLAPFDENI